MQTTKQYLHQFEMETFQSLGSHTVWLHHLLVSEEDFLDHLRLHLGSTLHAESAILDPMQSIPP